MSNTFNIGDRVYVAKQDLNKNITPGKLPQRFGAKPGDSGVIVEPYGKMRNYVADDSVLVKFDKKYKYTGVRGKDYNTDTFIVSKQSISHRMSNDVARKFLDVYQNQGRMRMHRVESSDWKNHKVSREANDILKEMGLSESEVNAIVKQPLPRPTTVVRESQRYNKDNANKSITTDETIDEIENFFADIEKEKEKESLMYSTNKKLLLL